MYRALYGGPVPRVMGYERFDEARLLASFGMEMDSIRKRVPFETAVDAQKAGMLQKVLVVYGQKLPRLTRFT